MSLLDSLRKGFNFFLLSLGISAPPKKPPPATNPTSKSGSSN